MALEQPFNIKITSGLSIRGVIDRIDNIEKDLVEVIDYKTGSRVPSQKEVDNNLQLTIYALAINSLRGFSFSRPAEKIFLSLYYLEEGVKISTQRTQDQLMLAKKLVIEMADKMEKEKLLPKPNRPYPCDFCEFRLLCDAYK
jgi:RecB family exonuclease